MDKSKNYYQTLGVTHEDDSSKIKKAYYKLSFTHHPDKGGDPIIFAEMTEAYDILCGEKSREEYDLKSKWGKNYNEYFELFDVNINYDFEKSKNQYENFKKNEVLNIKIEIDDTFDGSIEYERWVKCKTCDGSGKDMSSKIVIRNTEGEIVKIFDSDEGCDFCEGSGKDGGGNPCYFCQGQGKVGLKDCTVCQGEKRILGKQKLKDIKLTGDETKIEALGHHSKTESGKSGYLLIIKKG